MDQRFAQLPAALRERTLLTRIASPAGEAIPVLLAHPAPDWHRPREASSSPLARAPVVLWLHGRTASKELDPGRYLRWVRAGVAACAIDLPGHGERADDDLQRSEHTIEVISRVQGEIDRVVEALADPRWNGAFDTTRIALGGMSLGGMATLVRLCRPHGFAAAAVEAAAGSFQFMKDRTGWDARSIEAVEPISHLEQWRPIPLLALHSEADQWVPVNSIRGFADALETRYQSLNADPAMIELHTWPTTGAPHEHYGFGRVSNDAKNMQTAYFARVLT